MSRGLTVVMIVPTGIGATIGGHAGDANVAARLLGGVVDTLIVHPNVVNASDINEMPPNALYVEGSTLDRLLLGKIGLKRVKGNRILVACNEETPDTVNTISAAQMTLGADVHIVRLATPLVMTATVDAVHASGVVRGLEELVEQLREFQFDALAIHTPIDLPKGTAESYFDEGGINPWGGVEAIVSRYCSEALTIPVAHAPFERPEDKISPRIVDIRIAAEMLSESHLFSVIKGLHKSPRIYDIADPKADITVEDIDVLVSPMCWGTPHVACEEYNISIIMVESNRTSSSHNAAGQSTFYASNYYEAAGMLAAIDQGISLDTPL